MKVSLKSVVAASLLTLASASAFAQVTSAPVRPTTSAPAPESEAGGLTLYAYDPVAGTSLIEYLGINIDQIINTSNLSTSLNFGVLNGWSSAFSGSNSANIVWHVTAGDSIGFGGGPNYEGAQYATEFLATTAQTSPGAITNFTLDNTLQNFNSFSITNVNAATACNGANPCVADAATDVQYAGLLGSNLNTPDGAQLLTFANTGSIGSALGFYLFSGVGDEFSSATGFAAYAGQWLLAANGQLQYIAAAAPVPLPAAVWMLLSALAGLGSIARRRAA